MQLQPSTKNCLLAFFCFKTVVIVNENLLNWLIYMNRLICNRSESGAKIGAKRAESGVSMSRTVSGKCKSHMSF